MTETSTWTVKLKAGKYMRTVTISRERDRLFLKFSFNKDLMEEVKAMSGARWHGFDEKNPRKVWSVSDCGRNRFQLAYLAHPGPKDPQNPYSKYDRPLVEFRSKRPLYRHQLIMAQAGLTYRQCIFAAEMGTGKTLAAIEVMEHSGVDDWIWVGPRSALYSVQLEFERWRAGIRPKFYTYEALKKLIETWPEGRPAPEGLIVDEISRCKNPTAQRTQAVARLVESMRREYGDKAYVIGMSGSPAPKSPADWWSVCEIACVARDTLVLTSKGPKTIFELQSEESKVYVDRRLFHATKSWRTGCKQTYKITTKEGYEIKATGDHKFLVDHLDGLCLWSEVSALKSGSKIVTHDHGGLSWKGLGTFEEGYIIGHFYGDGSIESSGTPVWYVWEKDLELIPYLQELMPDMTLGTPRCSHNEVAIHSKYATAVLREFGEDFSFDRSSEFMEGYIAGLFDTNGTALKHAATLSIRQSDRNVLRKIQQALLFLGIKSSLSEHKESISVIRGKSVGSKKSWSLMIYGEYSHRFKKRIGFRLSYKQLADFENFGIIHNFCTVETIEPCGFEDVYDISVPEMQAFSANGLMAHNCPGFLREGTLDKFKKRLAIITMQESLAGGAFPKLVTWKDDPAKCDVCGQFKDDAAHDAKFLVTMEPGDTSYHPFKPSIDEVSYLYKRMRGLVHVFFKAQCLDLPKKIYKIIECKPTQSTLNAARAIVAKSPSTIQALILLRELSDGFQYSEEEVGFETCDRCHGTKVVAERYDVNDPDNYPGPQEFEQGHRITEDGDRGPDIQLGIRNIACSWCSGTGIIPRRARTSTQIACPKEDALRDLLEEHEDVGRIVIFAGFTGSIDRCVQIVSKAGWTFIRADGRGWYSTILGKPVDLLRIFQEQQDLHPRVAFIGQPGAAGMGLNLTASPTIVYYSNDFNAESRIQSEDRCHRPGMDVNRGCTIVDFIHLPTDLQVLNNLKEKRRLQDMSMGAFKEVLDRATSETRII